MYVKYARKYIRRHPILTAGSIFSLSLAFLAALLFVAITYTSQVVIKYFESKAQISAYIKDEAEEPSVMALKSDLLQMPWVARVDYVSKDQAKAFFISQNAGNKEILEALDDNANPFPASLEIEAKNIDDLGSIASSITGNPLIEDISYHKDVVDALRSWTGGIRLAGLLVLAAFSVISLLVVLITVSLTIFSKRDEMEIMKLLGAHKSFVRVPFILQGAFYGLSAAVVSLAIALILIYFSAPTLRSFFRGIPLLGFKGYLWILLSLGWLALGSILGGLVSYIATLRYLKD